MTRLRTVWVESIRATRLRAYALGVTAWLLIGGCGGVFTGIPELDTPDGRVFAQRCSACHGKPFGSHGVTHGVPDPRFRTLAEWQDLLPRMEQLMREKGLPSLTESERAAIIRYASRHAKS
ncbi:MAG: hypothetical protein IPM58_11730 [Nitrospira sp.]|nr:hypothetical protein [Nitrospira sp.]